MRVLTHQRVTETYARCSAPRGRTIGIVEVEGIEFRHTLLARRLDEGRQDIIAMLAALPEGFLPPHQGWSVTRMVMDGDGVVWTTDMRAVEQLCALGIGSGLGAWCAPRSAWVALPGGLPYVRFELPGALH